MTLPGFPPYHETKEATRKARQFLSTAVRNDWSFSEADAPRPDHQHPTDAAQADFAARGEVAWTQRRYSTGDETLEAAPTSPASNRSGGDGGRRPSSTQHSITRSQRQARLRHELAEECSTNAGLAHFCKQRDAWTSARPMTAHDNGIGTGAALSSETRTEGASEEQELITLLPIPQPILQEHPLRSRVDKGAYGEIYSKVILQGRTPSIPINLAHVTRALVHGWKEEGNWPPKDTVPEPVLGRKKVREEVKANPLRKGVQAMGRALRLGRDDLSR